MEKKRGLVDKTLLFLGRTIGKFPLRVKEKGTTTYVVSELEGIGGQVNI